jgi:subtilase family serine protease
MKSAKSFALLSLGWAVLALAHDAAQPRPSNPSVRDTVALAGTVPAWVSHAEKLGPADGQQRVAVTAYLSWRNEPELQQLIEDQATPGNARFGQFLTPALFHAQFSPSSADVRAVEEALQGLGLRIEFVPASGLFVRASGTVSQISSAFHVSQNLYSWRGKTLRAHAEDPVIPRAVAGLITYVGGLDESRFLLRPAHVSHAAARGAALVPSAESSSTLMPPAGFAVNFPCSKYWGDNVAQLESPTPFPYGSRVPWLPCGYTPQQLREAYGVNKVRETGRGVRVAITDLYYSVTLLEDVNRFFAKYGLPQLTYENFVQIIPPGVNVVPSGDPCGSVGWQVEQTLDVTAVHLMAPDAFIFFVAGTCDAADQPDQGEAEDPLYQVIDNRLADIVSNSWGYNGEEDVTPGVLKSDTAKFIQAAAQGMTLLFASGDDGDNTAAGRDIASGSWPPTSPYVTAVGGTSLLLENASGEKTEFGWANYGSTFTDALISKNGSTVSDEGWGSFSYFGGSGGGPSLIILEPSYQKKVVPEQLATRTYTSSGVPVPLEPARRVTPDISMVADPFTGLLFGETYTISSPPVDAGCELSSKTTEYCVSPIGGTSVATPLLAGVMALVNQARFSRDLSPLGFVNPALYRLPVGETVASGAPIVDVNAPSKPTGGLLAFLGMDDLAIFATIDSDVNSDGKIIENVDSSLRSAPGYDDVTGLGAPNVPKFIEALGKD